MVQLINGALILLMTHQLVRSWRNKLTQIDDDEIHDIDYTGLARLIGLVPLIGLITD